MSSSSYTHSASSSFTLSSNNTHALVPLSIFDHKPRGESSTNAFLASSRNFIAISSTSSQRSSQIRPNHKMRAVSSSRAAHLWEANKWRRHDGRNPPTRRATGCKFPSVSVPWVSAQRVRQPFRASTRPSDNIIGTWRSHAAKKKYLRYKTS